MRIANCAARCSVLLALWLGSTPAHPAAITLLFSPQDQVAFVGDVVNVDLRVDALPAGVSVGSFDFFVSYTPGIVGAAFVDFGPFLGDLNAFEAIAGFDLAASPTEVELFENSLLAPGDLAALQDPVRASGFRLATLSFIAGAPGISPLGISFAVAADGDGIALDVIGGAGSIEVLARPVPAPSALWLVTLAPALAAVLTAGRRRRSPRA